MVHQPWFQSFPRMSCVRWQPSSAGTPCAQRWRGSCCKGKEIGSLRSDIGLCEIEMLGQVIHQPQFFLVVGKSLGNLFGSDKKVKIEICLKLFEGFHGGPKKPDRTEICGEKFWLLKVFLKFAWTNPLFGSVLPSFWQAESGRVPQKFLFGG